MKNIENIKIDELLGELQTLKEENEFLKSRLRFRRWVNKRLKENLSDVTEERNELAKKLSHVTLWDLSEDEQIRAGKAFAQELLHGGA